MLGPCGCWRPAKLHLQRSTWSSGWPKSERAKIAHPGGLMAQSPQTVLRRLSLGISLFCQDIRLRTWMTTYVWSQRFVFVQPSIVRASIGAELDGCQCWISGQPQPFRHSGMGSSDWKTKILQAKAKNFTGKVLEFVCSCGLQRLWMWAYHNFKAKLFQSVYSRASCQDNAL